MSLTPKEWKIFQPTDNAKLIAESIRQIPSHWSLTPLQDKAPKRKDWQTEAFIPHDVIASLITKGEQVVSKRTGKPYRRYWSGYGLRTGEASGGLLAIDVDGVSAQPILEAMSGGNIPVTASWTSGKPGRYQLVFQIPTDIRIKLQTFTRKVVTQWNGLETTKDEAGRPTDALEFRYNRSQSALPPSRHPDTGSYRWINSPDSTDVAVAPDWLCKLLLDFASEEQRHVTETSERIQRVKTRQRQRELTPISSNNGNLSDILDLSLSRLNPEDVFNWSNHNWRVQGRYEWAGYCPRHDSKSGTAFKINTNTLEWYCFGCDVGGHAAQYRYFVNGGNGTPKGKDFAEIVKGLANEAGIVIESNSNTQPEQQIAKVKPTEQKKGFSEGYQEEAKQAWHKAKQFTVDIKEATQWCDWKLPPSNSIFLGKGGLGRGKTTRLRKWVRSWQEEGKGFICLGYRNTLLLQLCEKLGFYHLHENDAAIMRHDPSSGIALCVDSLWRFKPEEFDNKILILDEVMSVIKHLLHSPTVKGRDNILKLFEEALRRASQIVCLDGCMADWAVKYLHELAPDKKIIRAENTFQGDKPQIKFLLGTVDIDEEVRKNDRSPWLEYLLDQCAVPAACSDSQIFIESLDNLLTERGVKVLRIDSKTVSEEYVKEFLKDCNVYIEKYQPDVILYTPSAESGVDVSISDYFTGHFGFFFGVLGVDAILQMLGRIRDAKCTKFVWVREWVAQSEQTHSTSPFTKKVGQAIEKMLQADIIETVSGLDRDQDIIGKLWAVIQGSKNPHFEASNQIQAIANYEKSNLRECVLESLQASGYPIRSCTLNPSEEARETVKKATKATKRQNCHDIFTAEKIAPEFADDLSKKFDARWEDRVKVIQASYRSRLPGIDESESWTVDFIYKIRYDNPDFINQQELFWLFSHPEEANRMNLERYHRIAQKERTFIGNIRSRMARVRALGEIGLEKFLDSEKEWMEKSPELVELVERCRDAKIAVALGKHPGQQSNIRFLGSLLKTIGLKHKGQKVKSEDGGYRVYRLDRDILSDPDRRNALLCLDRRWENYVLKEVEVLDWEPILNPPSECQQVETVENFDCQQVGVYPQQTKTAQSQSGQGCDPVPRTPTEYIYTLEASWNQSERVESQGVVEPTEGGVSRFLEQLAAVSTREEFWEAVAVQDSQPRRQQLRAWYEAGVEWGTAPIDTSQQLEIETKTGIESQEELKTPAEWLMESFLECKNDEEFASYADGETEEMIETAIAIAPSAPIRQQLRQWFEVLKIDNTKLAKEQTNQPEQNNPPLNIYKEGDEVWGWFPQFDQWLKATVESIGCGFLRIKSGFHGIMVENSSLIAPGNWVLA
jgi:hypothetical protein